MKQSSTIRFFGGARSDEEDGDSSASYFIRRRRSSGPQISDKNEAENFTGSNYERPLGGLSSPAFRTLLKHSLLATFEFSDPKFMQKSSKIFFWQKPQNCSSFDSTKNSSGKLDRLKNRALTHFSMTWEILLRFRVAPSRVCCRMFTLSASMQTLSMLWASSNTTMHSFCISLDIIPDTLGSNRY